MRAGTTCFLGVNVAGALFALGDGHCRQGDGESCGVAVEAAMNTVVILDVLKGLSTPWPRLETDQYVMSTGSARPLEDAFRIAQADLVGWLGRDYGLHPLDAYQLLAQAGEAPVANVCDPNYTFVCKLANATSRTRRPTRTPTPGCAARRATTPGRADLSSRRPLPRTGQPRIKAAPPPA